VEYTYPLTVKIWYNFANYIKAKYADGEENNYQNFSRELEQWNACSDAEYMSLSFKTEHDRTLFLLRFS
jgi:hypothetical protein